MANPSNSTAAPPVPLPPVAVLACHVTFTLLHAILFANVAWLMPMLVRLRFGAADLDVRDWQTTLVTAAGPIFMVFSIFWHTVLSRTRLRTYIALFWLTAVLPLGCVALVQNYWQLLACHVVATIGGASWAPLNGKLLKHFYPDSRRGRAYGLLNMVTLAAAMASVYSVGRWLEADPEGFRLYFALATLVLALAVLLLNWLAQRMGTPEEPTLGQPWTWRQAVEPVLHMGAILRADRTFLRYERAFMTYGAAFMLCDALLPVLATVQLHMRYEDYAHATQVALRASMLLVTLPLGWLQDRVGPVRLSCLAFTLLALYPVLLLAATGTPTLAVASFVYGLGMAGVQFGWMLGPVALAGSPEKVPQYVAIHATLVGVRGILFQFLGMAFYKLTGSFLWPLVAAALTFAWAAWQMWQLQDALRLAARTAAAPHAPAAPVAASER